MFLKVTVIIIKSLLDRVHELIKEMDEYWIRKFQLEYSKTVTITRR